jgi:hypothetical protein
VHGPGSAEQFAVSAVLRHRRPTTTGLAVLRAEAQQRTVRLDRGTAFLLPPGGTLHA